METDSSFAPFSPASGDWEGYATRFQFLLEAKDITDAAKKRATFFSVCGEETFKITRALLAPKNIATVPYDTIMERLKRHFWRQPSVVACRNAFYAKRQAPGETITRYVTSLRQAARLCNFTELENMLRDRLVGGLRDEKLQRRLYAKKDLTFQVALEEALATEAAERSAQGFQPNMLRPTAHPGYSPGTQGPRMATDSSFAPFSPASGDWEGYATRFQFLLEAKDVTDAAKKRAIFFCVCGEETFEIARALLAPENIASVPYDTIMERLKEHFSPQLSVVCEDYEC